VSKTATCRQSTERVFVAPEDGEASVNEATISDAPTINARENGRRITTTSNYGQPVLFVVPDPNGIQTLDTTQKQ
jgi:hypothetical protein